MFVLNAVPPSELPTCRRGVASRGPSLPRQTRRARVDFVHGPGGDVRVDRLAALADLSQSIRDVPRGRGRRCARAVTLLTQPLTAMFVSVALPPGA